MAGAHAEVGELADLLSAPVAVTYLHNDAFSCDHPLYCGPLGNYGNHCNQGYNANTGNCGNHHAV